MKKAFRIRPARAPWGIRAAIGAAGTVCAAVASIAGYSLATGGNPASQWAAMALIAAFAPIAAFLLIDSIIGD